MYLRCFVGNKPSTWAKWLHWAEFAYNTAPHTSTKVSPFKALYGRDPPHLIRIGTGDTTVGSIEELLQERDAILDDLQFNLIKSQQIMKAGADTQFFIYQNLNEPLAMQLRLLSGQHSCLQNLRCSWSQKPCWRCDR